MTIIITSAVLLLSLVILASSCGPNQRILESANENQVSSEEPVAINMNATQPVSGFDQDLNAMRTADFKFIVVFRRKDGQPLDAADKELIRKKAVRANRRRLSDEDKAVIIGSNVPFITGEFDELKERFQMENYSEPESGAMFTNTVPTR
ncbi:MAG: hypothetical protein ABI857_06895 [Acidobacteriota bacterium]